MADRVLPILSVGGIEQPLTEPLNDLKPMVTEALGKPVRRIGRFIQLALIGAARCIGDDELPSDTAMWLASGAGDMNVTVEVLERICREQQSPKPLSFINTVSNAACFYLANRFGLAGSTAFVSRRALPLQAAMQAALIEGLVNGFSGALVGAVDEATTPLDLHRRRLGLPDDVAAGEGSWWFRFGSPTAPDALPHGAMGALCDVRMFADEDDLKDWLVAIHEDNAPDTIVTSRWPGDADAPHHPAGAYDSMAGAAVAAALQDPAMAGKTYLHIDRDPDGAWCLMEFQIGAAS